MRYKFFIQNILLLILLMSAETLLFAQKKSQKEKQGNTITAGSETVTKKDLEEQSLFIAGVQAYILGNAQEAISKFNEVLRMDARNDAALYELAKIAFESGNMEKAIEFAQNAIQINPYNEYYYQYLAEAKGEKQDYEGASKVYDALVKLKPREYDYYYDWAYMLSKANKYKEAIEVYNQLEQKTGTQEELIFQKQPLYIKLGKIEESVRDIEKLVKMYPSETRYISLIGEVYQSNSMFDKAIQTYQRILNTDSNNADALLAVAEIYRKKGAESLHNEYITKLFSNKDIDIDTKIMTFIPYIEKLVKDSSIREDVMKMADMIVAAHPEDVKAITARADVWYNSGKKKAAQTEYVRAINSVSEIPSTVWIQLYILDAELEDYNSLILHSQQGIDKAPDEPFGYFYNALAQQQIKNYKAAAAILLQSFNLPENKQIRTMYPPQLKLQMLIILGDVSFELKDINRCDSSYEAALEIDPNNATVLNNYAYYLSERKDKLEKAERLSKKSNLLIDNNAAFLDTYAWIMYKMENYKEALDWIEQALEQPDAKGRPDLLDHYGDILYKLGQTDKAVEQWEKALLKGGDKADLESKIKNRKIN